MRVFLVDGTYELFRHYYGVPPHRTADGAEVAATRGVLWSVLRLVEQGVTHLGVATDHVIESFRNDLWPGYKSSAGLDPQLLGQFGLLEVALEAMGVVVCRWSSWRPTTPWPARPPSPTTTPGSSRW
jgi:5'-3' exonuclease